MSCPENNKLVAHSLKRAVIDWSMFAILITNVFVLFHSGCWLEAQQINSGYLQKQRGITGKTYKAYFLVTNWNVLLITLYALWYYKLNWADWKVNWKYRISATSWGNLVCIIKPTNWKLIHSSLCLSIIVTLHWTVKSLLCMDRT